MAAHKQKLFLVLGIVLVPMTAYANAGTPLMWASAFHLLIGNALIGIFEGSLLLWMFKTPRENSIRTLIAANYASAWAGIVMVGNKFFLTPDLTIENIRFWFVIFALITFGFTLLIEFPFFWFVLRAKPRPVHLAIVATISVNMISYSFLFAWYWMASDMRMVTGLDVVSLAEIQPDEGYAVYFITPDGSRLIKMDIHANSMETVREISSNSSRDFLFARNDSGGNFDLYIYFASNKEKELAIIEFTSLAPISPYNNEQFDATNMRYGKVLSIASTSDWEFWIQPWALGLIESVNEKENIHAYYRLETPIAAWMARNATQLQGDYVVFQLGDDQICILDPVRKKIALLARGRGPIAVKP